MTDEEYVAAVDFARVAAPTIVVPPREDLTFGGIVGRARLVDVLRPCTRTSSTGELFETQCPHPWHMSDQLGFVLEDVSAVKFQALHGMPGLFEFDGYVEWRADGWPLCPMCEEDELYSLDEPATAASIVGCYRCNWKPKAAA